MKNKLLGITLISAIIAGNAIAVVDVTVPTVKNTSDRDIWVAFTLSDRPSPRKTSYTRFKAGETITLAESVYGRYINVESYSCVKGIPVSYSEKNKGLLGAKKKIEKIKSGMNYIEVLANNDDIEVNQYANKDEAKTQTQTKK